MIIKIIFMSILFLNILPAATLETKAQHELGEDIVINFTDMIGQNKDWIAIYLKKTNNDWGNVVKWSWTKDMINGQVTFKDIPRGSYEARAFYNNSFKKEASKSFLVGAEGLESLNIERLNPFFDNETLKVKLVVQELGPIKHRFKDWVGLYKKSASNDWGNVIKWTWANVYVPNNDDIDGPIISFGQVNLADGEYEVRYFLNNSFKTYMSKTFKIENDDLKLRRLEVSFFNQIVNVAFRATSWEESIQPNPKDWVGIYKKGATNAWANVIQWGWVKDRLNGGLPPEYLSFHNLPAGEYEARYFLNNSFNTYMTTDFKVQ